MTGSDRSALQSKFLVKTRIFFSIHKVSWVFSLCKERLTVRLAGAKPRLADEAIGHNPRVDGGYHINSDFLDY